MQMGIDSFAAAYDHASLAVSASDRLRNLVEQIERADQVGLDVFGIGEHHRQEYLDSARRSFLEQPPHERSAYVSLVLLRF
jgi:alkanesulfonate monooxygenase SsuD/methylene tetrahydromethanopterin reductase-like flavin-dependent oxidoreductase (luciferase family)